MKRYIIEGTTGANDITATKGLYHEDDTFYQFAEYMELVGNSRKELEKKLILEAKYIQGLLDAYDYFNL